jgi:dihydroneopterin aldolase
LPSEKEQGQLFLIDLELGLDLSTAGHSDRLEDTIDYGALARAVHDRVATERWDLLERVAHRVAELVMELPTVEQVAVTIHKPEAPIPLGFADVAVTVRLQR